MTQHQHVTRSLKLSICFILNYYVTSILTLNSAIDNYSSNGKLIRTPGEFVLGGIFPMHEHRSSDREYPCGAIKEEKGIQRLEAMLYAIDEINRDDKLLPNITLGTVIIDSCSSDTYALEQSMEFVRYYMNKDMSEYSCSDGKPPIYKPHKPVSGVVGASFSVVSIMVANILRLFKIPQISYASTSVELSDKSRFEYFSRVVPPDNFQAQALAEIVSALKLTYASTIAVEGEYGEKGIASFLKAASRTGICVALSEKILRNSKEEDFDKIIERLYSKKQARAVVMFVDEDNVRKLLRASIRMNKTGHFYWIASDSWGAKSYPVRDQEFAAVNTISILPHRKESVGFNEYFLSLKPQTTSSQCPPHRSNVKSDVNCRNIWFNEFWEQRHKCKFTANSNSTRCSGNEDLRVGYEQEGLVPFVIDAVYAFAKALDDITKLKCNQNDLECINSLMPIPGQEMLHSIHNVSFTSPQGTEIRFNEDGDAFGYYNIYQYQSNDTKYDYIQIGTWKESLNLSIQSLKWQGGEPKSVCSEPCPAGSIRNFQDQCCWVCVKCNIDAYALNDSCIQCDPGWRPNVNITGCDKIPAEIIDWLSPWALVPLIFSSLGICFTIFTTCVFIRYNKTPVIKASGRELCYMLLTGILCCYCMSFIILAPPQKWTCATLRIGIGLCLSICYSSIFIKTNRISRIFNQGVKSIQRPLYTSPISQVAISSGIVSIQLAVSIAWLIYDPPDVREVYPQPLSAVLTCKGSGHSLMISLILIIFLVPLCTIYAFKTRKIPENFNEAKYIGFTMYSTCIVFLASIAIYFGTSNDYKIQSSSLCMCLSISATVVLACLFAPKVYLVLFQPYKNVRPRNNGGRQGITTGASGSSIGGGGASGCEMRLTNRQPYSMRFSTGAPTTPTTTTSVELIESAQGKRGSNSENNAQVTTSVSSTKIGIGENQDNEHPQLTQDTNENSSEQQQQQQQQHHQPQLNGVKVMQDNSTSSAATALATMNGGDSNHQQITTIDPDRVRQTSEIYCGVSDGSQAQLKHDGNV